MKTTQLKGELFSSADVAALAGISKSTLHLYVQDAILRPSGSSWYARRSWTFADLFVAVICARLSRESIGTRSLLKAVSTVLYRTPFKPDAILTIEWHEDEGVKVQIRSREEAQAVMDAGVWALPIDVFQSAQGLIDDVLSQISQAEAERN